MNSTRSLARRRRWTELSAGFVIHPCPSASPSSRTSSLIHSYGRPYTSSGIGDRVRCCDWHGDFWRGAQVAKDEEAHGGVHQVGHHFVHQGAFTDPKYREVAAAAAANSENPAAIAPTAMTITPPPAPTTPPAKDEVKPATTSWSDMLGLWAWKKRPQEGPVPAAPADPAVSQEAQVKSTTAKQIQKP